MKAKPRKPLPSTARTRGRTRNWVPAPNLRILVQIAGERGIAAREVLDGTPLTKEALDTPGLRVPSRDAARIVLNAYRLTRDEALGLELGLRAKPTAHGYVGYAAMSCATLGEAMHLVARFIHLRQQDVSLRVFDSAGRWVLEAHENHELGPVRRLIHETLMIGFFRMAGFLIGEDKPDCELWFDWPEPAYYAAYRERLPAVRFGMPAVQARFPAAYAQRRLLTADLDAARKAVEECERELALYGDADTLLARVRAQLRAEQDSYPDLETVAKRLFMSTRTLKRKLEAHGKSFQGLLDEVRHRDALRLLENPGLDIQQIAVALGYNDPPSFTRAFRRWSGRSPSEARTRLNQSSTTS